LQPGSEPETIQLYEGEVDWNLNVYPNFVTAAMLSPDNEVVAIGTSEHTIQIYDRASKQSLFQLIGHSSAVRRLRFSPDGSMLASVDDDGVIMIWGMASQQRITLFEDHKGPIAGLVYRTDGDMAAWGSGIVWQINPRDGTLQHATSIKSGTILAASPAGDLLAVYRPFQVSLVDASNGQLIETLEGEAQEPDLDYRMEGAAFRQFYDAAFSQDGNRLATAGAGGVWYYDVASKELLQQLPGSNAQKVAVSDDGNWLLTSLYEQANPITVYDVQSGSEVFALEEYGEGKRYLQSAFSPSGRWVVSVKEGWDGPSELIIYDALSHQVYKSTPLEEDVLLTNLAFNPAEDLIAAGKADGEILLIDFSTLKVLATLTGHHSLVEHLAFAPDGQQLISASIDGTIRTWGLP
jgi:WD40 repeat protein